MKITWTDMQKVGICARGARTWFKHHGFDFRDFLQNGIDAGELMKTGDANIKKIVDAKIARGEK